MESAIKTVVSVYLKSAKGKESLNSKDFQSLVKNQLGGILNNAESSKAVKEMQQGLDDNQDGKVSFKEYMTLIGYLADAVNQQYIMDKDTKKTENNDGAVTQSEAPAAAKAEPAPAKAEEPAAEEAANGDSEAEKSPTGEEEEEAENTAEEETS